MDGFHSSLQPESSTLLWTVALSQLKEELQLLVIYVPTLHHTAPVASVLLYNMSQIAVSLVFYAVD